MPRSRYVVVLYFLALVPWAGLAFPALYVREHFPVVPFQATCGESSIVEGKVVSPYRDRLLENFDRIGVDYTIIFDDEEEGTLGRKFRYGEEVFEERRADRGNILIKIENIWPYDSSVRRASEFAVRAVTTDSDNRPLPNLPAHVERIVKAKLAGENDSFWQSRLFWYKDCDLVKAVAVDWHTGEPPEPE